MSMFRKSLLAAGTCFLVTSSPHAFAQIVPGAVTGPLPTPARNDTPIEGDAPVRDQDGRQAAVDGIVIDGLTDYQAQLRLRAQLAPKLHDTISLDDNGRLSYDFGRAELGCTVPYLALIHEARNAHGNVALRYDVNFNQTMNAMRDLADEMSHPREYDEATNNQAMLQGHEGTDLSVTETAQRIKKELESNADTEKIELIVARRAPDSGSIGQFQYLLAAYDTPYNGGIVGRTTNLRMAARHVNGTVVQPGAIFSTNTAIGPRDAENGWKEAQMFVNGEVVNGVGSGICQCATTVYNAALLAGLPIVERHAHMFHVTYAAPSRDATIYWGSKDMRFRNDTPGPIYVQTFLRKGRFYARLYGTTPNTKKVNVVAKTLSHKGGIHSEAFRIVYVGDTQQTQLLSRDFYMPHPTTVSR